MRAEPGAPPGPSVIPTGVRQHPWGHLCAAAGWATAAVTRRGWTSSWEETGLCLPNCETRYWQFWSNAGGGDFCRFKALSRSWEEKILRLGSATDVRFKPPCLSFPVKSQNEDNASFFLQWASRDGAPSHVALEKKAHGPAVPRLHSGTPGCTFPRMRKMWRTSGWAEKLTAAAAGSLRASSAGLHLRRGSSRILLRAESVCVYT